MSDEVVVVFDEVVVVIVEVVVDGVVETAVVSIEGE